MQDSTLWFVVAFGLLILELLTGTFYLLVMSLAAAIAGGAAYLGSAWAIQLSIAAVIGAIGVMLLRRSRFGKPLGHDAQRDPNVNLDIGQVVQVPQWNSDGTARVMYRGAAWDVELSAHQTPAPGAFRIVELRGSRLIVEAVK